MKDDTQTLLDKLARLRHDDKVMGRTLTEVQELERALGGTVRWVSGLYTDIGTIVLDPDGELVKATPAPARRSSAMLGGNCTK